MLMYLLVSLGCDTSDPASAATAVGAPLAVAHRTRLRGNVQQQLVRRYMDSDTIVTSSVAWLLVFLQATN